ncbi:MAG: hypothetical protein B7Z51_02010 [Methyloversatilis sp. 12-65-5]|nr:MAG: hypothetical protein B7Z51_02010 [Methyloversatilis sp. 12-65-5]
MVQRSGATGGSLKGAADDATIARELLAQVALRGAGRSICPSEVARALAADWRALMPRVREVTRRLAREGRVVITQGGEKRDADGDWRGPIRIAQGLARSSGST